MIYDNTKPIGIVIDAAFFHELMAIWSRHHRPTIAELLDELDEIHIEETDEIEVPPRVDRDVDMGEMLDELSL
ncbi:MAG: hypothetical protein AAF702_39230 [Chloroflexota bacterium]